MARFALARTAGTALLALVTLQVGCHGSSGPPGPAPPIQPLAPASRNELSLPMKEGSLRLAIVGDTGTGTQSQRDIGQRLAAYHKIYPFTLVLMLGDNIYGADTPRDFKSKFEDPYAPLLAAGVKFYASLGNHDNPNQAFYRNFNMGGKRYYSFSPQNGVRFFAIDSNYLDPDQLAWLEKELAASGSEWKIAFFHHPLYSSGDKHGPALEKRQALEPLLLKHGVRVVLTGHEHFYERIKPQKGIYHFISGGAAKLRPGRNVSEITDKGFDDDYHFMLAEIAGDELYFQTITRTGKTVDSGLVKRTADEPKRAATGERKQ
jgi:hypothetical protein